MHNLSYQILVPNLKNMKEIEAFYLKYQIQLQYIICLNLSMKPFNYQSNNDIRKKIQDYSYALNDKIGKGFSSSVFRGINEKTNDLVAIKVIDIKSLRDKIAKKMLDGQIQALRKLHHINILKCHDVYTTVNNCYIITQFCNEGDLGNLLQKRGKLSQQEAIPLFRDIYLGFKCLADANFLHRDLKPANILIKDHIAKIGDFGFTKKVSTNPKENVNVGSPLYMSPQALKNSIYTVKNDIWSLGIIFYEMLHGKTPWQCKSQTQLIQNINTQRLTINKSISEDIKDFIRSCLQVEEFKRIDLKQLAEHPFILKLTLQGDIPKLLRKPTSLEPDLKQQFFSNPSTQNIKPMIIQNGSSITKAQKLFQSQINWMRVLYKVNEMFPQVHKSSKNTIGLRFIVVKQTISQLKTLKKWIKEKQNNMNAKDWNQFVKDNEKVQKYTNVLRQYGKKYYKIEAESQQWIKTVALDHKLACIADKNYQRSQLLSILGISYSLQQIQQIYRQLKKQTISLFEEQLPDHTLKLAHRLDFLISYNQINCLLIDNFNDFQYFSKFSKVQLMAQYRPHPLQLSHLKDIYDKMTLLELIK